MEQHTCRPPCWVSLWLWLSSLRRWHCCEAEKSFGHPADSWFTVGFNIQECYWFIVVSHFHPVFRFDCALPSKHDNGKGWHFFIQEIWRNDVTDGHGSGWWWWSWQDGVARFVFIVMFNHSWYLLMCIESDLRSILSHVSLWHCLWLLVASWTKYLDLDIIWWSPMIPRLIKWAKPHIIYVCNTHYSCYNVHQFSLLCVDYPCFSPYSLLKR